MSLYQTVLTLRLRAGSVSNGSAEYAADWIEEQSATIAAQSALLAKMAAVLREYTRTGVGDEGYEEWFDNEDVIEVLAEFDASGLGVGVSQPATKNGQP